MGLTALLALGSACSDGENDEASETTAPSATQGESEHAGGVPEGAEEFCRLNAETGHIFEDAFADLPEDADDAVITQVMVEASEQILALKPQMVAAAPEAVVGDVEDGFAFIDAAVEGDVSALEDPDFEVLSNRIDRYCGLEVDEG